jgi:putative solute:sodium symporter small subunit
MHYALLDCLETLINTWRGNLTPENRAAYWQANLRLVALCMAVWFLCSFGFGILLVDQLNSIRIGGFQLGFWFAQQGSIYIFVALIFFYAWRMNKMDQKYDVHED